MTARREEVEALRGSAAACATGQRCILGVAGADHRAWLERIASNPVQELKPGELARVTLMDGKGRMRADMRVLATPDLEADAEALLLDVPASHKDKLARMLDMYIIQDKVTITDRSADLAFVTLAGPRATEVAANAGLPDVADGKIVALTDGGWVLRSAIMAPPALDLLIPAGATGSWLERLASAGATTVDAEAFDVVRIGQGLPWFGPDLSADVIPLEAQLDDWVSITKGCYPGQEVVARIQNLGSVARKLVRLSAPGEVALEPGELAGTGELADKTAGVLTSVAYDPVDDITRALGYVRRAYWKTGSHVRAGETELDVFALDG